MAKFDQVALYRTELMCQFMLCVQDASESACFFEISDVAEMRKMA
jgi:hypothetical protein